MTHTHNNNLAIILVDFAWLRWRSSNMACLLSVRFGAVQFDFTKKISNQIFFFLLLRWECLSLNFCKQFIKTSGRNKYRNLFETFIDPLIHHFHKLEWVRSYNLIYILFLLRWYIFIWSTASHRTTAQYGAAESGSVIENEFRKFDIKHKFFLLGRFIQKSIVFFFETYPLPSSSTLQFFWLCEQNFSKCLC